MINVLSHSLVCERGVVSCSSLLGPGALVPTWLRQGAIWYRKVEGLKAVNGLGWYLCSCSPGQSTCLPPSAMHGTEETSSSAVGTLRFRVLLILSLASGHKADAQYQMKE